MTGFGALQNISWARAVALIGWKQISFFECVLAVETDDVLRATDKTHCISKAKLIGSGMP